MAATRYAMDEYLDHFKENGYVVVHGALSPEEVARVNDGIDAYRAAHPEEWVMEPRLDHDAVGRDAPGVMERTEAPKYEPPSLGYYISPQHWGGCRGRRRGPRANGSEVHTLGKAKQPGTSVQEWW